ncbi:alkaline phosphatase family protein [bacterium]|nr:alkaline phosphatase family protein [bacterium]
MINNSTRQSTTGLVLMATEGFLWVGLLLACLATILLIKGGSDDAVGLMESQGLLWWQWLMAFYLSVAMVLSALNILILAALQKSRLSLAMVQVVSIVVLGYCLALNHESLAGLFSVSTHPRSSLILTRWALTISLMGLALVGAGLLWIRPKTTRGVSVFAVLMSYFALSGSSPAMTNLDPPEFPLAVSSTGERLLVIGLDGADWRYMTPLIDQGQLPHLESLRNSGAWGDLKTLRPTRSARIWTSVVTGVEPQWHGVISNTVERLRGSYHRLPEALPLPRGLGVHYLATLLRYCDYISPSTVAGFDRKVPAFWTIATRNKSPVDFINWWASWPVEQISGHSVSDRFHFWRAEAKGHAMDKEFVTYPDSLLLDLAPLVMRPDQVTLEHALQFMEVNAEQFEEMKTTPYSHHRLKSEFKYFYSMFVSNVRIALELMDRSRREIGQPSDLFVLLRIIDQASHQALAYSSLVSNHLDNTPEEIKRYSQVVTEAYRNADLAVGQLVEAFGDGNVVILSDHGFKLLGGKTRNPRYGHSGTSPPDGIFIAAGPAFQPGPVAGLGIYDIMPLFLALKGWPIANDFVRGVPIGVFSGSFFEENPIETIDSYGTMRVSLPEEGPILADEEMVKRLRALGYLD